MKSLNSQTLCREDWLAADFMERWFSQFQMSLYILYIAPGVNGVMVKHGIPVTADWI